MFMVSLVAVDTSDALLKVSDVCVIIGLKSFLI